MSVFLILSVLAILASLVVFALLLGGVWEAPERLKERIMGFTRKTSDPPVQFRAWVETDLGETPALRAWLLSLSEEGFKALTQRVVAFCADLNIQLSWLVERHLEVAPDLRKATQTIVVDYLEVCWEAIRHQDEIALFSRYHKLLANPADSRYRDLRRRLFTRLAAEGLTEPLPSYELIMASELQRQALAAKAIREAADKDWKTFAEIFGEVLEGAADSPQGAAAG